MTAGWIRRRHCPTMAPLAGPWSRGSAAVRGVFWLEVLVVGLAMTPLVTAYRTTPQLGAVALPPNSFVNLSNADQLAAYAQSQALPADANVTRACGCECLPSWTHMILPDYNNLLVALSNYTALVVKEHACAADNWPVPWCYVNTTTCPSSVPCVDAIAPWAPCSAVGDKTTLPQISNFDCSIGGAFAAHASPDDAVSEDPYAEFPMGCECLANWTFAGETWHGCANPGDDWPSFWCYVNTTTCLPGAWACAIEQGLWGQCESEGAMRTSNTSSLHMCQVGGPGLHGITPVRKSSSESARNLAIVVGATCGLLAGVLLLVAAALAVTAEGRKLQTAEWPDDEVAEKGDLDNVLERSRGWGSPAVGNPMAISDGSSCAALASSVQAAPLTASGSQTAAASSADVDAVRAASLLSTSPQLSIWALTRVSDHAVDVPESHPGAGGCARIYGSQGCAVQAGTAKVVSCWPAAADSGEPAEPMQESVGSGSLDSDNDAPPQEQKRSSAASCTLQSPALQSEDDAGPRALCPAPGVVLRPSVAALAANLSARHCSTLLLPTGHGGQPRLACGVAMSSAPSVLVDPRSRSQAPGCHANLMLEEPADVHDLASADSCEGMQLEAIAMVAATMITPPLGGSSREGDRGGSAEPAAFAVTPGASPKTSHGGDALACNEGCEVARPGQQVPLPAAEAGEASPCPGNPFAAARMQYKDDTEDRPPPASVRRWTPTPLLSTLRPDDKGRGHPLLRW